MNLQLPLLAQQPDLEQRRLRLCVGDIPGEHLGNSLLQRHGEHVQKFILVQLLLTEGDVLRGVHVNGFVAVGAGREKQTELDELPRDRAGLL